MKKTVTILALCAMLYSFPGWNGIFAQEPLQFIGNQNNPVLTHGDPGSYDGELFALAYPIWDNGTFYLFYLGNAGVCFATSADGYNFTKYAGNPVLTPSGSGFDSLGAGPAVVIKVGAEWVMYYNARQYPGWGPGESVGRATANSLTGTWERSAAPVLTLGNPGEWDSGLICPNSVLPLDTGGFIMFYYASDDFNSTWLMGMATSPDGITWTKYNDPNTAQPPFADSDPIMPPGEAGAFDQFGVVGASVLKKEGYFEMYYSGVNATCGVIGYASSVDGITWEKWPENPIYVIANDPYAVAINANLFEQPGIFVYNSTAFMYYDYGVVENSIGLATADVPAGINDRAISNDELRITNSPNPVNQSTTFSYELKEPAQVKLEIFDSFGRLVGELVNGFRPKGEHNVTWNAEAYPAGIYYCRLQAGGKTCGGKMIKR